MRSRVFASHFRLKKLGLNEGIIMLVGTNLSMEEVTRMKHELAVRQRVAEHWINLTPTGDLRNKLTEANIHLMSVDLSLTEVLGELRKLPESVTRSAL